MKVKSGDTVKIIAGKDKGKVGKVLQAFPDLGKVVVEGVATSFKHLKSRGKTPGQRVEFTAPIAVSNVAVMGKNGSGRVSYKHIDSDGRNVKVRVLKTKAGREDLE